MYKNVRIELTTVESDIYARQKISEHLRCFFFSDSRSFVAVKIKISLQNIYVFTSLYYIIMQE